jgi:hypothetical protein
VALVAALALAPARARAGVGELGGAAEDALGLVLLGSMGAALVLGAATYLPVRLMGGRLDFTTGLGTTLGGSLDAWARPEGSAFRMNSHARIVYPFLVDGELRADVDVALGVGFEGLGATIDLGLGPGFSSVGGRLGPSLAFESTLEWPVGLSTRVSALGTWLPAADSFEPVVTGEFFYTVADVGASFGLRAMTVRSVEGDYGVGVMGFFGFSEFFESP